MSLTAVPIAWCACPVVYDRNRRHHILLAPRLAAPTLEALRAGMRGAPLARENMWATYMLTMEDAILTGPVYDCTGHVEEADDSLPKIRDDLVVPAKIRQGLEAAAEETRFALSSRE